MEILIDDHAVRMLRTGLLDDEEIRRVVASQKIANDLERIGDLAVNISERVISLAGMNVTETPARSGTDGRRRARNAGPQPGRADLSQCGSGRRSA